MTTDEIILALVERHGFKLPEGLFYEVADGLSWFLQNHNGRKIWHLENGQHVFAHDLCAMEFVRQAHAKSNLVINQEPPRVMDNMALGWAKDAIKALYDAMEAK